jgi:hypothetical protein
MLNGTYFGATLFDGRSSGDIDYVITVSINNWCARQVNTLEFDPMVWLGGHEGHIRLNACMQSDTREGYGFLNGLLFYIEHCLEKWRKSNPKVWIIKLWRF